MLYRKTLKNKKEAIYWYKKAIDLGDMGWNKAKRQLKKLGVKYEGKEELEKEEKRNIGRKSIV